MDDASKMYAQQTIHSPYKRFYEKRVNAHLISATQLTRPATAFTLGVFFHLSLTAWKTANRRWRGWRSQLKLNI